ncbi:MAG: TlpA family protein disulfide reductase [Saprospiraceae bacterium]|nr:TlpA family protein disulfide reductase [Saprospiraceae bacterium]
MKNYLLISLALITAYIIIRYFYFAPKLVFGEPAPSFEEKSIHDSIINLDKYKGRYLLIDFWGSWCNPCRRENIVLPLFYSRYKDAKFKNADGLSILNIALENKHEAGLNAIQSDKLDWPDHIIQIEMMNSSLPKLFGIKQIPFKYLIGPDSKILLSNPDFKELDDFLAHNLSKN